MGASLRERWVQHAIFDGKRMLPEIGYNYYRPGTWWTQARPGERLISDMQWWFFPRPCDMHALGGCELSSIRNLMDSGAPKERPISGLQWWIDPAPVVYMSPSPPLDAHVYANGNGLIFIRPVTNLKKTGGLGEVGATSFWCGVRWNCNIFWWTLNFGSFIYWFHYKEGSLMPLRSSE